MSALRDLTPRNATFTYTVAGEHWPELEAAFRSGAKVAAPAPYTGYCEPIRLVRTLDADGPGAGPLDVIEVTATWPTP